MPLIQKRTMQSGGVTLQTKCGCIPKPTCGAQIYVVHEAKYWCSDKFSFRVHLKAFKAYTVDIVHRTDDSNGDWTKLQDYRPMLNALGIMPEDRRSPAKRPRTTACGESRRRVKHKSDFNKYVKTVVINLIIKHVFDER